MIVINAGVPRSGTVLVNAYVRHVIDRPVCQENLAGAAMDDRLRARLAAHDEHAVLIHAHDWTETTLELVRTHVGFLSIRDPRDVAVSLARLHELSLDEAIAATQSAFASFALAFQRTDWMVIRYEQMISDPQTILGCIANELGASLSPERAADILSATSPERHAAIMRFVASARAPRRAVATPRRTLWEDPATLINDRHIQSGAVGRWKTELSPREAAVLCEALAVPVQRHGY